MGARKSTPKVLIMPALWLGPTPILNRPGARLSITWICWTSVTGCRDHVCTMDVPSLISSVTAAAAARTVTASPPPPLDVSQAHPIPISSKCTILSIAACAFDAVTETPMTF